MYVPSRWSQQYLTPQGCVLEIAPSVEMVGEMYIPKTGERAGSLQLPATNWQVNLDNRDVFIPSPSSYTDREVGQWAGITPGSNRTVLIECTKHH